MTRPSDPGDTSSASPARHGRRRFVSSLVAVVVLAGAGAALLLNARTPAPSPAATQAPPPAVNTIVENGVIAYYFHTTYRCTSCRKIEAYSKVALETGFGAEIADGRLLLRTVNIEDPGNEHFVEDYKLYTKSLILSERSAGREVRWKNLNRVWELLNDEPAFVDYVQAETRAFLASTP